MIVLLYFFCATVGLRVGAFGDMSAGREVLNSFILAVILTYICIVDSRIAGKPIPISVYWLVFMLFGIAVPVCIISAHGKRGLVIVAIHIVGLVIVYVATALITSLLIRGTFSPY